MDSASDLARIVNEEIRALAESFTADGDGADHQYGFLCEDGCGAKVLLTLAAFIAAQGAWLDGHKPTAD